MFLFLTVIALDNAGIHISSLNSGNMMFYIIVFVNDTLGFGTIVNNSHIRFGRCFDYMRLER